VADGFLMPVLEEKMSLLSQPDKVLT